MFHSPATRFPGTRPVATEAKVEAFLPVVLLSEHPEVPIVLARLAQYYIEHIAVRAM